MKNKDIITKIKNIPIYELSAMQEYLEAMAEQGLFFVKHNGLFWTFIKGEPQKVHYYVDMFDKASHFDSRPEAETIDYLEYCASCGWIHIFTEGKLQFFASYDENPIDIQTDPMQRLKSINKTARLSTIFTPLIIMLSCAVNLSFLMSEDIALMTVTEFGLAVMLVISLILLLCIVVRYLIFYTKNKERAKNNETLVFSSCKKIQKENKVVPYALILLMLGISFFVNTGLGVVILSGVIIGIVLVYITGSFYGKNRSRKENKTRYALEILGVVIASAVTVPIIVFGVFLAFRERAVVSSESGVSIIYYSNDEIPYTLKDAGFSIPKSSYIDSSANKEKLLTGVVYNYEASAFDNDESVDELCSISYSVAQFNNSKNNDKYIKNQLTKKYVSSYDEVSSISKEWKAEKVYKIDYEYDIEYLICYDNMSILISENLVDNVDLYDMIVTKVIK